MKSISRSLICLSFVALAPLSLFPGQAQAIAIAGNTIIGVFSDPIYQGYDINYPSLGQNSYSNNSSTAPLSTFITNAGSTLTWGTAPDLGIPAAEQSSSLTFQGATNLPTNSGSNPLQLGKITYYNGSSDGNSLIYGAKLSFYLNSVLPANLLGSDTVVINTTANYNSGSGLTTPQLEQDADYINICGNSSNLCGSSIEAYEANEGGTGVVADLSGVYVSDPSLTLTGVTLDPNNAGITGTIGTEPALGLSPVPLPGGLGLLGSALLGLVGVGGARRKLARNGA